MRSVTVPFVSIIFCTSCLTRLAADASFVGLDELTFVAPPDGVQFSAEERAAFPAMEAEIRRLYAAHAERGVGPYLNKTVIQFLPRLASNSGAPGEPLQIGIGLGPGSPGGGLPEAVRQDRLWLTLNHEQFHWQGGLEPQVAMRTWNQTQSPFRDDLRALLQNSPHKPPDSVGGLEAPLLWNHPHVIALEYALGVESLGTERTLQIMCWERDPYYEISVTAIKHLDVIWQQMEGVGMVGKGANAPPKPAANDCANAPAPNW